VNRWRARAIVVSVIVIWAALPLRAASAAPGDLDPTFGTDGIASLPAGTGWANAVAMQSDGRLVLAGSVSYSSNQVVARMNPDGTPDESFGSGGFIILPLRFDDERVTTVAVQSDGRVLVAVVAYSHRSGYVIRLKADGSVDRSFGSKGVVDEPFFIVGVALQGAPIVLGGETTTETSDFVVARLLKDGQTDTTFGTGGSTTVDVQPLDSAWDLTLDGKGRILLAGYVSKDIFSPAATAVLRFERGGAPDPRFGDGGVVVTAASAWPWNFGKAVAVDGEGRVIVAGETFQDGPRFIELIRYRSNGHLDSTFGDGGIVITHARVNAVGLVAPGADGSVYVGGTLDRPWKHLDDGKLFAARYLTDGTLDPSFGREGIATAQPPGKSAYASAGLVQPDGKVVLAGGMGGGRSGGQMLALRFLGS
jgi:uncharacterized delta-60 repeat protein